VLLAGGTQGKRFALPHSRVMIHQPWGGAQGTAIDMEIQIKETLNLKKRLEEILGNHCGKSGEEIAKATRRDNFLSPEEAKEFGLIDHIVRAPKNRSRIKRAALLPRERRRTTAPRLTTPVHDAQHRVSA